MYEKLHLGTVGPFDTLVELLSEQLALTFRMYEYKETGPSGVLSFLYLFQRRDGMLVELERKNQDRVVKRINFRKEEEKAGKLMLKIQGEKVYVLESKGKVEKEKVLKYIRQGYEKAHFCRTALKEKGALTELEQKVLAALNIVTGFDTKVVSKYILER